MKVAIEDCEGWYKDDITGAVQCADTKKYNDYMRNYRATQKQEQESKEKVTTLQKEVSELKSEMGEIKSLLLTLVQTPRKHYDD